jgi:hypothetical protein
LLKISGIWETDTNYGVTYKFIKMSSTPIWWVTLTIGNKIFQCNIFAY